MAETVLILGASENPMRYSHMATLMLLEYGHHPILVGKSGTSVAGLPIHREIPENITSVDTITLYLNPLHQQVWYSAILALKPARVIFNPGTENEAFMLMLSEAGIDCFPACTLVLLRTQQF
jgi:predicted CoA-binding protein